MQSPNETLPDGRNKILYSEGFSKLFNKLSVKPDISNFTEYRNWVIVQFLRATSWPAEEALSPKVSDVNLEEKYFLQEAYHYRMYGLDVRYHRHSSEKKLFGVLEEYIRAYRTAPDGSKLDDEYLFCDKLGRQRTPEALKADIVNSIKI